MLVVADDLTGALEAGVIFAQRGITCSILTGTAAGKRINTQKTTVTVVNIESRHLPEPIAAGRVVNAVERAQPRASLIYKKTDSTLRGNIFAELDALSRFGPVMYAPAYPANGRTVRDGQLLVEGLPVTQTAFRDDLRNPVESSDLQKLIRNHGRITVHDAHSDGELERLAYRWLQGGYCAAGPGGLLHAVARIWSSGAAKKIVLPPLSRALVICGSLHSCSREQMQFASHLFKSGQWTSMETSPERGSDVLEPALELGNLAAAKLVEDSYDACIVFGGDTAAALLHAMQIETVEPIGEFVPGIAICKLPGGPYLITKAGGFGSPDLLPQIHARFQAGAGTVKPVVFRKSD